MARMSVPATKTPQPRDPGLCIGSTDRPHGLAEAAALGHVRDEHLGAGDEPLMVAAGLGMSHRTPTGWMCEDGLVESFS